MPVFNNGFPVTYPQFQPFQTPQQMMTLPTIRAEIVQVESLDAAKNFQVGAGQRVMMQLADDSAFVIKTAYQSGPPLVEIYDKRPPAPPEPIFTPEEYVRRDELPELIAAALATHKRPIKKEATDNGESV